MALIRGPAPVFLQKQKKSSLQHAVTKNESPMMNIGEFVTAYADYRVACFMVSGIRS